MQQKQIPAQMWKALKQADRITTEDIVTAQNHARERIVQIGARYGFSEQELVDLCVISAFVDVLR